MMAKNDLQGPTPIESGNSRTMSRRFLVLATVAIGLFALLGGLFGYDEFWLREEMILHVKGKKEGGWCVNGRGSIRLFSNQQKLNCSFIETEAGYLGLPKLHVSPVFGGPFQFSFWNQNAQLIWDHLKPDCDYHVVVTGNYATRRIVRILKPIDSKSDQC